MKKLVSYVMSSHVQDAEYANFSIFPNAGRKNCARRSEVDNSRGNEGTSVWPDIGRFSCDKALVVTRRQSGIRFPILFSKFIELKKIEIILIIRIRSQLYYEHCCTVSFANISTIRLSEHIFYLVFFRIINCICYFTDYKIKSFKQKMMKYWF